MTPGTATPREVITVHAGTGVPWADFFNTFPFFEYHRKKARGWYFELRDKATQKPLCVTHFTEKEPGLFCSPLRGTYGGIDALENDITLFGQFLAEIERHLQENGGKRAQLSLPPFAHDPARSTLLLNVLLRRNWAITTQEINYALAVDGTPLLGKMERNNQKRVRKCEREQCTFLEGAEEKKYRQIYEIIRINRTAKGYPITMTWDQLLAMKTLFPDTWKFFGVEHIGNLIAGSVCIRVNPRILYVFYWGDLPEAHTLSPVAFLAGHLYRYCQREGTTLLDIGTATDKGVPNVGLMTFKERLGCTPSPKLTLVKVLG